jgi:hypothetical protein
MNADLLKKLDRNKLYTWDEMMEISTILATEFICRITLKDIQQFILEYYVGKSPNIKKPKNADRKHRKTRGNSDGSKI